MVNSPKHINITTVTDFCILKPKGLYPQEGKPVREHAGIE